MDTLGNHVIAELWGCNEEKLNDLAYVEQMMVNAALDSGAEIREVAFHQFTPQGVSGVVIISESHLTIHSFPEHGYASVDVYTCGDRIDPLQAANMITEQLDASSREIVELPRGKGALALNQPTLEVF